MTHALVLIILLVNHGFWMGGQEGVITPEWAVQSPMPAAVLEWRLSVDRITLTSGKVTINAGAAPPPLKLIPPEVRVVTRTEWEYILKRLDNGDILQSGNLPVTLYPTHLFSDVSKTLAGRTVSIVDPQPALADFLQSRGIANTRLKDISTLQAVQTDILLVAPGTVGPHDDADSPLVAQARAGASVAILMQNGDTLAGYRLTCRPVDHLWYRMDHPLLSGLNAAECHALFESMPMIAALALPSDEPALDIVSFPRETPGANPVPIDSCIMTTSIGRGRLVSCQCPLPSVSTNPLTQTFLNNLLTYLATRPEPTLRPSERQPAAATSMPAIKTPPNNLLSGAHS